MFGSFYKLLLVLFSFYLLFQSAYISKGLKSKAKKIASEEPMSVQYIEKTNGTQVNERVCNSSERKIESEFEWSYFLIFLIVKKTQSNAIKQT